MKIGIFVFFVHDCVSSVSSSWHEVVLNSYFKKWINELRIKHYELTEVT